MPPTVESTVFSSSQRIRPVVATEADSSPHHTEVGTRAKWQWFIDRKLIEWGADPDYFDDEDFPSPSHRIITLAIEIAGRFRDSGEPPPHRVVPDADGGIVFERRTGGVSQKIHIWDDGTVDSILLNGTQVVERHRLLPPE